MANAQNKAVSNYRRRLQKLGIVRLEVHVRKNDAKLVRDIAKALSDPAQELALRALLQERFGHAKVAGLKELLAAAPLEGIDLTRSHDIGRTIDL